jgi:hypothetical protein
VVGADLVGEGVASVLRQAGAARREDGDEREADHRRGRDLARRPTPEPAR